jgi:SpoIID/LytB domain protein
MARVLVALLAGALVAAIGPPAHARPRAVRTNVDARVTIAPLGKEPLRVAGLHAYFGRLSLRPGADGLVMVNHLGLERYLMGLNEVPPDWPMEALRAQAIAARTYALWTLARPPAGAAASYGFDICASDECQVYSGAGVARAEDGARWVAAVKSTAGRALLFEGEPILARYHSTSGGRTLANSDAFEGDPDLPYLRSVPSEFEHASPLYRWTVRFGLGRLQSILEAAGWWSPASGRLRRVRSVEGGPAGRHAVVALEGGATRRRTAEELRALLREFAPRLFPRRYPSAARTASGRLPETLPSDRINVTTRGDVVEIRGRGWGHGVGMSQWGAYGMARRGHDHEVILAHYYPGTSLGRVAGRPVEVGVDWGRESVDVFGALRVTDATGAPVIRRAFGTWRFRRRAPDGMEIVAPRGYGRAPRVALMRAPSSIAAGKAATLTVRLEAPARLVATARPDGPRRPVTRDAGRRRLPWRAPSRPGRYTVRVRAWDGSRALYSDAVEIVVTEARSARPLDAFAGAVKSSSPGAWLWLLALAFIAVLTVGCASFAGTIRR